MKKIQAWHFVGDRLRCGTPIPKDGVTFKYSGHLKMCETGLHASRDPFDALQYAPGPNLCLVECGGQIIEGEDKLVCSERTIIGRTDATEMLRYFARMQALSVIHLWDAPDVMLDYLMTGEENIRGAAWDAARGAAWDAARGAARDAARGAAWSAAWGAAWGATRGAAWDAAWGATWDARGAARDAARKEFNGLVRECFWQYL